MVAEQERATAPMSDFERFVDDVNNLVREWASDEPKAGAIPREALRFIYDGIRERAVNDVATWQEQCDKAMEALHKHYLRGFDK
jgi:hypothetical protein